VLIIMLALVPFWGPAAVEYIVATEEPLLPMDRIGARVSMACEAVGPKSVAMIEDAGPDVMSFAGFTPLEPGTTVWVGGAPAPPPIEVAPRFVAPNIVDMTPGAAESGSPQYIAAALLGEPGPPGLNSWRPPHPKGFGANGHKPSLAGGSGPSASEPSGACGAELELPMAAHPDR